MQLNDDSNAFRIPETPPYNTPIASEKLSAKESEDEELAELGEEIFEEKFDKAE